MSKLYQWLGVIGAAFVVIGGTYAASRELATKTDVELVSDRLDQKILSDRLKSIEERIWRYEDKCGEDLSRCDEEVRDTLRRLRQERREIEMKLKKKG